MRLIDADKLEYMQIETAGRGTVMSNLKCPICNNTLQIGITYHNGGMDGLYKNWIVSCPSCNMFQIEYAADSFYGRESYTKEQVIACI